MPYPTDLLPDTGSCSTEVEVYVDPDEIDDGWAYRPLNGHPRLSWALTIAFLLSGLGAIAAVFIGSGWAIVVLLAVAAGTGIAAFYTKPVPTVEQLQVREMDKVIAQLKAELAEMPEFSDIEREQLEAVIVERDKVALAAMEPLALPAAPRRRPSPRPRSGMLVLAGSSSEADAR